MKETLISQRLYTVFILLIFHQSHYYVMFVEKFQNYLHILTVHYYLPKKYLHLTRAIKLRGDTHCNAQMPQIFCLYSTHLVDKKQTYTLKGKRIEQTLQIKCIALLNLKREKCFRFGLMIIVMSCFFLSRSFRMFGSCLSCKIIKIKLLNTCL